MMSDLEVCCTHSEEWTVLVVILTVHQILIWPRDSILHILEHGISQLQAEYV